MWTLSMALALGIGQPAPAQAAELPGWLAGCWEQVEGERWTEECWTSARGGTMLGSSRTGRGATVTGWEAMQIMLDQPGEGTTAKMAFWASPGGQGRTMFAWAPSDQPGVTFVNGANDYPQRIRYWREGELLNAEISLADGSKPMRWTFRRTG